MPRQYLDSDNHRSDTPKHRDGEKAEGELAHPCGGMERAQRGLWGGKRKNVSFTDLQAFFYDFRGQ